MDDFNRDEERDRLDKLPNYERDADDSLGAGVTAGGSVETPAAQGAAAPSGDDAIVKDHPEIDTPDEELDPTMPMHAYPAGVQVATPAPADAGEPDSALDDH